MPWGEGNNLHPNHVWMPHGGPKEDLGLRLPGWVLLDLASWSSGQASLSEQAHKACAAPEPPQPIWVTAVGLARRSGGVATHQAWPLWVPLRVTLGATQKDLPPNCVALAMEH